MDPLNLIVAKRSIAFIRYPNSKCSNIQSNFIVFRQDNHIDHPAVLIKESCGLLESNTLAVAKEYSFFGYPNSKWSNIQSN